MDAPTVSYAPDNFGEATASRRDVLAGLGALGTFDVESFDIVV